MRMQEYVDKLLAGEIPMEPPHDMGSYWSEDLDRVYDSLAQRRRLTNAGIWCIIDRGWTDKLAKWIGDRTVLEIMAGSGALAYALTQGGASVIATDNQSWDKDHSTMRRFCDVEKLGAVAAVRKYRGCAEVLLCSWPPHRGRQFNAALREWGDRPVVYIGEHMNGCTEWPRGFVHLSEPEIHMKRWPGLHDEVFIGFVERKEPKGG